MEIRKKTMRCLLIILFFMLSACSLLPGMQNQPVSGVPQLKVKEVVKVQPVIVPITASLLVSQSVPTYIYHVAPQDVLSINVWQHPEFNPPMQVTSLVATQNSQASGVPGYLVDYSGYIYFPLAGRVYVSGQTTEQIRRELTERLREYVRHPQVNVRVSDYRSKKVYIFGEVMRPGLFPLNDQPMSITDALTMAGSFDPNTADTRHIYVIRGDFTRPKIYWLDANTPDTLLLASHFHLQPGDVLYVSTAPVARFNRFLNQLLPTLQTVYFTKTITSNH